MIIVSWVFICHYNVAVLFSSNPVKLFNQLQGVNFCSRCHGYNCFVDNVVSCDFCVAVYLNVAFLLFDVYH